MYDTPIPMINYVFVTITASVLAYATAMDIDENTNEGSATDNLPLFGDSSVKEAEPEPEPEQVEESEPEPEPEEVPIAEAQLVPQTETEKSGPAFGGKRNARKIKKTKRNAHNSKKHKQTRNKNHSK
jgi:outer membrane biosynthesis protein TonB